jgi:tetratricopeptide (TPR) repeat protein
VARFRIFAVVAILLAGFDLLRSRRRREAELEAGAPLHPGRGPAATALLLLLLVPGQARSQSDWARGDRAFRAGEWAAAESLYARRSRHGGPEEVRVNLATTRAKAGQADLAERELAGLAAHDTRAGRAAGYNLGTLLGEQGELERALAALRATLKRDPADEDARWNYEVILRGLLQRKEPKRPRPDPQRQLAGGGGSPPPQNVTPNPAPPPQPPVAGPQGAMNRAQAERLLDALAGLERSQRERQRKVRPTDEKRGRDW